MRYIIKNQNYEALIDTLGAEIIELKKDNKNILWNRDTKYWGDSALVLFPFIGRNYNDTYLYKDKEYNIGIHGFALKKEFNIIEKGEDNIALSITSDEETLKVYPFEFTFVVKYYFLNNDLRVEFIVNNNSNVTMPFTCGFHPGFMLQDELNTYKVQFPFATDPKEICIVTKCMLTGETKPVQLTNKCLSLSSELFKNSAKVYTNLGDTAILIDKYNKEIVKLKFEGLENIVLWQTLKSNAPFICIEGWRGLPGTYKHIDDISEIKEKTFLASSQTITYSTTITY